MWSRVRAPRPAIYFFAYPIPSLHFCSIPGLFQLLVDMDGQSGASFFAISQMSHLHDTCGRVGRTVIACTVLGTVNISVFSKRIILLMICKKDSGNPVVIIDDF